MTIATLFLQFFLAKFAILKVQSLVGQSKLQLSEWLAKDLTQKEDSDGNGRIHTSYLGNDGNNFVHIAFIDIVFVLKADEEKLA